VLEAMTDFFSSRLFMPHGHCYLWQPALLWLQVIANGLIGLAYLTLFVTLVHLVRRIKDIPFQWMYIVFSVFIVACGITHFSDIYVIWHPEYWLDGAIRAITAVASVGAALLLPPLVPKAVALADAARVAHDRGLQLEVANRELAILLDRSQELEQLKTQFFANVSHELRTPLTLILGPVDKLLSSQGASSEQRRDIEVIGRNARTLLKHVNDLLDLSKVEARKMTPEYAEFDVALLVRSVAGNFDGIAGERGIEYSVETPASLPGQVDRDKLQRIMLNLLSNAFKFTPPNGRVRCSVRAAAEGGAPVAVVDVADSGPGVPPEHRDAIFERFRQADGGAARRFGGTGLGLSIAKDFVELQGGRISAGEAPEGGALFQATLPLKAPDGVEIRALRAGPATEAEAAALQEMLQELRSPVAGVSSVEAGDEPLVLVVEDNPEMNRFVREVLAEDYRTAAAYDGREGLRKAIEHRPDLVVSDVMMPAMSGEQLVEALREREDLDEMPILLLTASSRPSSNPSTSTRSARTSSRRSGRRRRRRASRFRSRASPLSLRWRAIGSSSGSSSPTCS
jgi:signal transduction histidine kinase/CheY-like chemotaxis protein